MDAKEIVENDAYVQCAAVYLKRAEGMNISALTKNEVVDAAIRLGFDGDASRFLLWADDYISDGCGVAG